MFTEVDTKPGIGEYKTIIRHSITWRVVLIGSSTWIAYDPRNRQMSTKSFNIWTKESCISAIDDIYNNKCGNCSYMENNIKKLTQMNNIFKEKLSLYETVEEPVSYNNIYSVTIKNKPISIKTLEPGEVLKVIAYKKTERGRPRLLSENDLVYIADDKNIEFIDKAERKGIVKSVDDIYICIDSEGLPIYTATKIGSKGGKNLYSDIQYADGVDDDDPIYNPIITSYNNLKQATEEDRTIMYENKVPYVAAIIKGIEIMLDKSNEIHKINMYLERLQQAIFSFHEGMLKGLEKKLDMSGIDIYDLNN
eukprot:TRINITY_DN6361_c0_g1_i1.p1 TRINITY_DN6361_c0_g1~~TRINITY_DN6361_c0_g1_i1.p1  ORF type:complete len:307 (+),score=37.58 TRINITY_DN6361_c0_g1_i1:47-967(+)